MGKSTLPLLSLLLVLVFLPSPAKTISSSEVGSILIDNYDDGSIGPVLVRLAWHASGTYDTTTKTGGSDGATMRFTPEAAFGANAGAPARAACAGHISVTGAGEARCDGAQGAAASRPARA